mmetsp:Transcript_2468/g.2639  ORF Transcript_2468/g.2639 Transcript_2468/m.2639 type:complete len:414 (+) Transcript_2468:37-1278(+)|eukprot:CAMPEP_0194378152 /NCGR_PEP_ID=MMETSP0174-20130528/34399_1 /TAXON_ID=216777 /ORGANISM="Proboscia alata, Strain PI-D3" /LENGTH=413 /DNA_ID=CAMNT_0039159975 /DNA_START=30 /DNA_END=1271 /DNA_ORIENTATION=+
MEYRSHIPFALFLLFQSLSSVVSFSSYQNANSAKRLGYNSRGTNCNIWARKQTARSFLFQQGKDTENRSENEVTGFSSNDRRKFLASSRAVAVMQGAQWLFPYVANSEVVDETAIYAPPDSSYSNLSSPIQRKDNTIQSQRPSTDEVLITFTDFDKPLGIELGELSFRTNTRIIVKTVLPNSTGQLMGVKKDYVVIAVNGVSTERTDSAGVQLMVSRAVKAAKNEENGGKMEIRFRDPAIFQDRLRTLSDGESITTTVAPSGDTTQRTKEGIAKEVVTSQADQKITVSQLKAPILCTQGAETGDLIEISYVGTVVETGAVFDGSTIKINGEAVPGRGGDITIFFVLNKQPFNQFPPGWNVGMESMCIGERRRILVPPVLAYGSKGVPRRGIPPDATLQYDVTLISINGLAVPK